MSQSHTWSVQGQRWLICKPQVLLGEDPKDGQWRQYQWIWSLYLGLQRSWTHAQVSQCMRQSVILFPGSWGENEELRIIYSHCWQTSERCCRMASPRLQSLEPSSMGFRGGTEVMGRCPKPSFVAEKVCRRQNYFVRDNAHQEISLVFTCPAHAPSLFPSPW